MRMQATAELLINCKWVKPFITNFEINNYFPLVIV